MTDLELLAPARNADIGIAAIDCGADAVYLAGPGFGARQGAGNSIEEIRRLCAYARKFGARVFVTVNTIVFDGELSAVRRLLEEVEKAGADAVIAQDLAVVSMCGLPVHASTQCAVRTPEKAVFYESLGCSRLVLERELSLQQIREIRGKVGCELEFFVHGALCVCYSGQCYLSENISGRSANRGECVQACRSLYDLTDADGNTLVRNKALLSLKDLNLLSRLEDLAEAGVNSFKIEGRLKNISYVRNVVKAYSSALDALVAKHPDRYRRASFGSVTGGFTPALDKTFNRGYTSCFIDGVRGAWSSMEAPKSMGEEIGTVVSCTFSDRGRTPKSSIRGRQFRSTALHGGVDDGSGKGGQMCLTLKLKNPSTILANGDGFSFVGRDNEIVGFRGDVCSGSTIRCKEVQGMRQGIRLFRNFDSRFEKETETNLPSRLIRVRVDIEVFWKDGKWTLTAKAVSEDGRASTVTTEGTSAAAENQERMRAVFASQVSKRAGECSFTLNSLVSSGEGTSGIYEYAGVTLPFLAAQELNALRRALGEKLEAVPCKARPMFVSEKRKPFAKCGSTEKNGASAAVSDPSADAASFAEKQVPEVLTYKENVANRIAAEIYVSAGASSVEEAYELSHRKGAELMRTKYCIRHELGLCPLSRKRSGEAAPSSSPKRLFLLNNGRRYALSFDCRNCEMTVSEA